MIVRTFFRDRNLKFLNTEKHIVEPIVVRNSRSKSDLRIGLFYYANNNKFVYSLPLFKDLPEISDICLFKKMV